jgi:ribosomal protein S18 acetylase RimI-like enzyme
MLPDSIIKLIRDEQSRTDGRFIAGADLEAYLDKLAARAEILADSVAGRCRGFVAFYGNDVATRQAYITLVLVDPQDRAAGIGRALVTCVLDLVRRRGFEVCRLEVSRENLAAHAMYVSLGFAVSASRDDKDLMEVRF